VTTVMEQFPPWLRDVNRLFGQESGAVAGFVPPADVLIDDEGVHVYMDVPGLGRGDVEIELDSDVLTVRGERAFPYSTEGEGRAAQRIERGFGRFERSLRVPRGLDPETVEAALRDGVLQLRIPKPASQQPKKIEIRELDPAAH